MTSDLKTMEKIAFNVGYSTDRHLKVKSSFATKIKQKSEMTKKR